MSVVAGVSPKEREIIIRKLTIKISKHDVSESKASVMPGDDWHKFCSVGKSVSSEHIGDLLTCDIPQ